ncbi:hypothetical protein ACH5RR_031320 [Cinchona calisaya]|uniref:FLZ-type domain-containing protein n=1 Tax=Cinchona calisaya TaxID=153742 RepID=A0ABD2YK51_9GENT
MADIGGLSSPSEKQRRPISSIFSSPRLFTSFASKGLLTDSESLMSPTSILDSKPFSALRNSFWSDSTTPKTPKPENKLQLEKLESRSVGLGLTDALSDESDSNVCKQQSRMVVFGSQLKIQIPPLPPSVVVSPADSSPKSPAAFGIKTRNSQMGSSFSPGLSPSSVRKSPFGSSNSGLGSSNSPRIFSGLSLSEMELSEDYTCVISHGPNPRTTHIFDDCIVESCSGQISSSRKPIDGFFINRSMGYPSDSFLSFCYNCKKNLGQGKDIYMYRGEKAFCSSDCRDKEMMLEEGMEISESDDIFHISSS